MHKKVVVLGLFALTTFSGNSQAPYGIKSCKIVIVYSVGFAKGTKTIIFADSGRIEKTEGTICFDSSAVSKTFPMLPGSVPKAAVHSLTIQTVDSIYSIDLDSMYGSKQLKIRFLGLPSISDQVLDVGKDTLLGKMCTIKEFLGCKIWYWKGLALKKEFPKLFPQFSNVYEYATKIEETYIIQPDEFAIPKNVKWNVPSTSVKF